ncbi:hypothetical protein ACJIZ3_014570 [Penstemon smallii]|uniref:Uncharacterized protein n=1 Tax=Penstemon smallii TaxID=265156 RepID=A0ABD3RJY7_9LAMI
MSDLPRISLLSSLSGLYHVPLNSSLFVAIY